MPIYMQSNKDHEALVYSSLHTCIFTKLQCHAKCKKAHRVSKKQIARSDYYALTPQVRRYAMLNLNLDLK